MRFNLRYASNWASFENPEIVRIRTLRSLLKFVLTHEPGECIISRPGSSPRDGGRWTITVYDDYME